MTNPEAVEHCEIIQKLYSSKNFNEFVALAGIYFGASDFKTLGEPALLPKKSPLSDFFPQRECKNWSPSFATVEVKAKGALHWCEFKKCADGTDSTINSS